jgi:prevent-host-death family protein
MTSEKSITVSATTLRRDLGVILDTVSAGTSVHVIRHGRPLCTLVPPTAKAPSPPQEEDNA